MHTYKISTKQTWGIWFTVSFWTTLEGLLTLDFTLEDLIWLNALLCESGVLEDLFDLTWSEALLWTIGEFELEELIEDFTWLEYLLCISGVFEVDLTWFVLLWTLGVFEVDFESLEVIWLLFGASLECRLFLFASFDVDCVLFEESGLLLEVEVLLDVLRLLENVI